MTSFSLVIPFYNEEGNCERVVLDIQRGLDLASIDYELILVNNGSRDSTGEILEKLARNSNRIKVITVPENQGYGWGIISGLKNARGQYLGYMWGDGQVKAEDLLRIYRKLIEEKLDLSKAVRSVRLDGLKRKLVSFVYNNVFNFLFGINSRDINATPKIMTRKTYEKLNLTSRDWFLDPEIVIKCRRLNCRVGETEIIYYQRQAGKSNVSLLTVFEFVKNTFYYLSRSQNWKI